MKLIITSKFRRALRKFIGRNAVLQQQIEATLMQMEADIYAANLATHRLKGDFEGLRACSCGYDCRIIFSIEEDVETEEKVIVLLNVGSHDEVY